jgi:hypothetical protein
MGTYTLKWQPNYYKEAKMARNQKLDEVFGGIMQCKPSTWDNVPKFPIDALSDEVRDALGRLMHVDVRDNPCADCLEFAIAAENEECLWFIGMRKSRRTNKEQRFLISTEGSTCARSALRLS